MNKIGFLGLINLIVIILVIVGVVVSYNFFKNNFVEKGDSEEVKSGEEVENNLEKLEDGDLVGEDSGNDLEIE